ncbi:MAG: dihydropteroate synthase [Planctomycetota bacterium]|nr:dihydropteroate synthase [Planctomycetota bacterium]MDI6787035.1 dihydropteroate synthase [Planctomycetota bacterium]
MHKILPPLLIPQHILGVEPPVCAGQVLSLNRFYLIGVLNVTPDSFSDGNKYYRPRDSIKHSLEMLSDGADIIDIGGESTRPGAKPVPPDTELKRVIPVIKKLVKIRPDIIISIDTYKARVAEEAIKCGARMVNDISGLGIGGEKMASVVAHYKVPLILMHIKGTPLTMQRNPYYRNLKQEIFGYFRERIQLAEKYGIKRNQIIIDPGLGFGKRLEDNYAILGWLSELHKLGQPIMLGPSRKSFIGKVLNLPPDARLEGTAAVVTFAVIKGVQFIRVHDVKEMKRVVTIAETIKKYDGHH